MADYFIENETQAQKAEDAVVVIDKTECTPVTPPMDQVEHAVASFLEKAIQATVASNALAEKLDASFIEDLENGTMSTSEKIALFNIERQSSNDRLFKLITPTFGVITERQRAEIQAKEKLAAQQASSGQANVQVNIGSPAMDSNVSEKAPAEVILGLNNLFQLMNASKKEVEKKEEKK